ncbi:hypothetical protein [Enterococcus sp. AZ192]|uniref:hypothetical protein n=1 Tax=unclassified Enterococcus TaxID=2608891 RepID=UPI003D28CF11
MIQKKLLLVATGAFWVCLGMSTEASAMAYGGAENFVVSEEDNKRAIAIVEENGGLDNCPVPIENLTLQQPKILAQPRAVLKTYAYTASAPLYGGLQVKPTVELVPVGFTWADNGIPWNAITQRGGTTTSGIFNFKTNNISTTGSAGYGTGGYFWTQFRSTVYVNATTNTTVTYWLSAWDLNHLLYG